jgi:4-coumarate--CoA ligase
MGRSQVDYILAAHAVWAAGCVVSTVNHSSAPKEIVHALKIVKPRLLIVDVAVLDKVRRALAGLDVSPAVMTLVQRVPDTPLFPDDLLTNERIDPSTYVLDGRDARTVCAAVVLSSGTTGLPKAVMLSHHNLVCISEMLRAHNPDNWRGSQREVFFPPRECPPFHMVVIR